MHLLIRKYAHSHKLPPPPSSHTPVPHMSSSTGTSNAGNHLVSCLHPAKRGMRLALLQDIHAGLGYRQPHNVEVLAEQVWCCLLQLPDNTAAAAAALSTCRAPLLLLLALHYHAMNPLRTAVQLYLGRLAGVGACQCPVSKTHHQPCVNCL